MDEVYVVIGLDLGWDCVVGVFKGVSYEDLEARFGRGYVIRDLYIQTNLDEVND